MSDAPSGLTFEWYGNQLDRDMYYILLGGRRIGDIFTVILGGNRKKVYHALLKENVEVELVVKEFCQQHDATIAD